MNRILWFTLAILTARTGAIPANVDSDGTTTTHDLSKREIAYENLWMHKDEPLDVCRSVEASMVPSLRSRMYDSSEEFDEELGDIFLPIKYHREAPWAINSPANIPGKYLIPTERDYHVNNVYGPPGLNENDYAKDIVDLFDEPTDEELQVFFKLDDTQAHGRRPKYDEGQNYVAYYQHPRWPLANETPKMIRIEDVKKPPVPLIYDPLVMEESELTAETHDIVDVEINEREREENPPKDVEEVGEAKEEVVSDQPTTPHQEPTTVIPEENGRNEEEEDRPALSSSQTKMLINDMLDSIRGIENFEKIERTLAELIGDLEEMSTSEFEAADGEALKADELKGSSAKSLHAGGKFFLVNICGFNVFLLRYLSCHFQAS